MDLNVQNAKLELIQWLSTLEDKNTLKKLLEFRKISTNSEDYKLSESEKESIEKGLQDLKNGEFKEHSDVRKIYEKWL